MIALLFLVAFSLVGVRMDYCNTLRYNRTTSPHDIDRFHRLQTNTINSTLTATSVAKFDHISAQQPRTNCSQVLLYYWYYWYCICVAILKATFVRMPPFILSANITRCHCHTVYHSKSLCAGDTWRFEKLISEMWPKLGANRSPLALWVEFVSHSATVSRRLAIEARTSHRVRWLLSPTKSSPLDNSAIEQTSSNYSAIQIVC